MFSLPGAYQQPPSAAAAGMDLANEWLGDSPYSNPAVPRGNGLIASPVLLRVSRQDLRAGNHSYDEKAAFLDSAGAALSASPADLALRVAAGALRDFVFNRGSASFDPSVQPALVEGQASMRETRAGVTASTRVLHGLRVGGAVEWTWRDDSYDTDETSGAPDQGAYHLDFNGKGVGGTLGFRYDSADSGMGTWVIGGGVRSMPQLDMKGQMSADLLSGASDSTLADARNRVEAAWPRGTRHAHDFLLLSHRTAQAAVGRSHLTSRRKHSPCASAVCSTTVAIRGRCASASDRSNRTAFPSREPVRWASASATIGKASCSISAFSIEGSSVPVIPARTTIELSEP
jgi:hypothetical protein